MMLAGASSFGLKDSHASVKPPKILSDQNKTILPLKGNSMSAQINNFGGTPTAATLAASLSDLDFSAVNRAAPNTTASKLSTPPGLKVPSPTFEAPSNGGLGGLSATAATPPASVAMPTLGLGMGGFDAATKTLFPILRGRRGAFASASVVTPPGFPFNAPATFGSGGFRPYNAATVSTPAYICSFGYPTKPSKSSPDSILSSFQTSDELDPRVAFNQLEEQINKCSLELEEQEHFFAEKATEIKASDKVLTNNNQKILELNDAVQKVKIDQKMAEKELELIVTHSLEVDEILAPPSENEIAETPKEVHQKKEDEKEKEEEEGKEENRQTDLNGENLDTQLRQISVDFEEIMEGMNEVGEDMDLIVQIDHIFNAHITTLQWFQASLAKLDNKFEDIDKVYDTLKCDVERSLRSENSIDSKLI